MLLLPVPTPLAKPVLLIVATDVFEEPQATVFVRFWVEPSLYFPVAVNCWVVPLEMEGSAGVTAIEDSTAAITVRVVDPATEPNAT